MDLRRIERLLDSGSFELNLKDQSVVCSKGFLQLLSLNSATDLSNWSDVLQFVHKDHIKHIQFLLQLLKKKRSNFHEVLSWVTASKEIISLRTIGEFVEGAEGAKVIFAVQKDQSVDFDSKRNLLLQSVIERANDGVLITEAEPSGPEGRKVLYVNPAFTKLTGYKLEEIVGKTPKILQGPRTDDEAIKEMSMALKKWEPCELSLINYRKNGEEFWMKLSMTPVADDKGWYTHWVAIERDATSLVLRDFKNIFLSEISMIFGQSASSKIAMQQMTEKVLEFGDFSMAEVWVPNQETKKLYLVSYSYKDDAGEYFYVENNSVDEFAYGEGLPGLVWQNLEYVFMEDLEQCHSFERKLSEKSADLKFGHGIPLVANGDFQGVLFICAKSNDQSVSDRVDLLNEASGELALEIKRKNAEDDYNQLFINAPDLICTCGFDGVFRRINAAGENILGYSRRVLLSKPFIDFVHPEDKTATEREFLRLTKGHSTIKFENRYLDPNGKTKWLSWSATSFPDQRVIHAVAKDITDHKMVEKLLQEASAMAQVGSWEYDMIDEVVYWSPMTAEIHGESSDFKPEFEELINYFKEEDRDFVVEKLRRCMELGEPFDFEAPIVTKKKEEVWIRIIGKAELINGECVSVYGSLQDINQRKQTELRLNHIANNLPGVIFQYELAPDGSEWMNYVSKGSYDIWGLSPEECMEDMGKIWEQVEAGGSVDELKETIRESLQSMSQWNSTARIKNADGELIWLEGLGIPRKRQNGNIIWDSIVLNVTEKIELSDSLRRAGRMSKVGSWEVKIIDKQATQVFLSSISCEIFEVEEYHEYNLSHLIEFF